MDISFHGTPASIRRKSDGKRFDVKSIYFSGDRRAYVITITEFGKDQELGPGEYRTDSIYYWEESTQKISIKKLD